LQVSDNISKIETVRLFKRDNGYWYISLKRGHQKSLNTKDESVARGLYRKIKKEVLMGRVISLDRDKRISIEEFIEEYIKYRKDVGKESATVHLDEVALNKFKDCVGSKIMNMVNAKDIDIFHAQVLSKGCKPVSLNAYIRHLKTAFKTALRWGYITQNFYADVKQMAEPERYDRILADGEILILLKTIDDMDFRDYVIWALFVGGRPGDVLYITWEKVGSDCILVWDKKTKKDREVPIVPDFKPIVERMRKKEGRVFPRWKLESSVSHLFKKYMDKAKIPSMKLHGCRHTFASYLAMAGVAQKAIMDLLGHKQMSTTERYMHFHPDRINKEASKLKYAVNWQSIGNGNVVSIEDYRDNK
jgi:integrase